MLNIKDARTAELAAEVAALAHENKTQAIRVALEERLARLQAARPQIDRSQRLLHFLETEVWPLIPESERGRRMTKAEREEILGYGPDGV